MALLLWLNGVPAAAQPPAEVPLLTRQANEQILLVFKQDKGLVEESKAAEDACRDYGMKYDVVGSFDKTRVDYGGYHAILAGSNAMDYWKTRENKEPTAFGHLEEFVKQGGHLVLFGSFAARNMEHLRRFGVKTGPQMTNTFRPIPGVTELLVAGNEQLVPDDGKMKACGSFTVSKPHVVLLRRGPGANEGDPIMATIPYGQGRVTLIMVEPSWQDDMWLIRPVVSWIERGGPVLASQADKDVVLAASTGMAGGGRTIPSESLREKALADIREMFQQEFATLGDPGSEKALAKRILAEAKSAEDQAVRYFVLLDLGARFSAEAGDPAAALRTLKKLGARYDIDLPARQVHALESAAEAARDRASEARVAAAALDLVDELVDDNAYGHAEQVCEIATASARLSGDAHLNSLAPDRKRRVGQLKSAYEDIAKAVAALEKNADNPEANGQLGRFLAFEKGDWDAALPHLVKSEDPQLRKVAGQDLARPNKPKSQLAVANAWWVLSGQARGAAEQAWQQRAAYWYRRVIPELSGSVRVGVLRKLARTPSTEAQLRIGIKGLHGTGTFHLTPDRIRWEHGTWSLPDGFRLNQIAWDLDQTVAVDNRGATRYLPEGVVLETVRLVKRQGQVKMKLVIKPGKVMIELDDHRTGKHDHELLLTFGK